jgi:hypothetical protein
LIWQQQQQKMKEHRLLSCATASGRLSTFFYFIAAVSCSVVSGSGTAV